MKKIILGALTIILSSLIFPQSFKSQQYEKINQEKFNKEIEDISKKFEFPKEFVGFIVPLIQDFSLGIFHLEGVFQIAHFTSSFLKEEKIDIIKNAYWLSSDTKAEALIYFLNLQKEDTPLMIFQKTIKYLMDGLNNNFIEINRYSWEMGDKKDRFSLTFKAKESMSYDNFEDFCYFIKTAFPEIGSFYKEENREINFSTHVTIDIPLFLYEYLTPEELETILNWKE